MCRALLRAVVESYYIVLSRTVSLALAFTSITMSSVLSFDNNAGGGNQSNNSSDDNASSGDWLDNPIAEAVVCYGWVLVVFYCALCKRRPRRSTNIGDQIRQRARENAERLQRQEDKKLQSPEDRKKIVDNSIETKKVISKDAEGNLALGRVDTVSDIESNDDETQATTEEKQLSQTDDKISETADEVDIDYDDEDQTCVICLDPFLPKDIVSWSKHSKTCSHVFHTDCIRPWLEDRKQDECPSCRSVLLCYPCAEEKEENNEDGDENHETDTDASTDENQETTGKEESFFVIMHGLISMATARITRIPSAYDLVSLNSNSFDSSEGSQQSQDQLQQQSEDQLEEGESDDAKQDAPASAPLPLRRVLSDSSIDIDLAEPIEMGHAVTDISSLAAPETKADIEAGVGDQ